MIARFPHLCAALVACFLLSAGLLGGIAYADSLEMEYVHAIAPLTLLQKRQGLALQRVALRQNDLLPIYGSSELNLRDPFRASKIFLLYPTGFNVFTVGGNSDGPILQLQMMAGMGAALRGKRVAISLSPQFYIEPGLDEVAYRANYSRLHAYALALSGLPASLKQRAAERMLQYPDTVQNDALLWMVLTQVADERSTSAGQAQAWSRLMYVLLYPLAKLQELTLELQDHWEVVNWIWEHPEIQPAVQRRAQASINWEKLQARATVYAQSLATNNRFGIPNRDWLKRWREWFRQDRHSLKDVDFLKGLDGSRNWSDLELLLEIMKAEGAQPLVISMPLHGLYWDMRGVSASARQAYYEKLRALGEREQVPVVTFDQFENDKYFLIDPGSHLSARGWVYYSQALNAFYHGELKGVAP